MKICSKCGKELPKTSEYFKVEKGNKDGLTGACRKCIAEQRKQYRINNKENIAKYDKQYRIDNKEKISQRVKQYRIEHKEKILERERQYRIGHKQQQNTGKFKRYRDNHKKELAERFKQWRQSNPEKANIRNQRRRAKKRQLPATLTNEQWDLIKDWFNNKCCYCGKEKPLTQDHFVPLYKGGEYTHNNILPACLNCNSSKGVKDAMLWYRVQTFYNRQREQKIFKYLNYYDNTQQLALFL